MRKTKFLSIILALTMIVGILPFTVPATAEDVTTVYVSNKYGADTNGGLTADDAVKTIAKAINLIGTANDGKVIVVDGKDSDGNLEYEVYTRGSDAAAPVYGGTQNVLLYSGVPAHTGTITYEGLTADSVICYGANHLELKGPTIFKDLTLIEGYNTGKQIVSLGNSLSFEGNVQYIRTKTTSNDTVKEANLGLAGTGNFSIDISGRTNVTKAGVVSLTTGTYDTVAFGGWDSDITFSENQKVYVGGDAHVKTIKLRNNKATWAMKDINVVIDGGTVDSISDVGTGTATADAVQIIMNNGTDVSYTPTGITLNDGEWIMHAENDGGSTLDVTDTAGTFDIKSDKYAYIYNGGNTLYYYRDTMTVEPGEYSVKFVSALSDITETAQSDISTQEFDKWVDNGDGTMTAIFKTKDTTSLASYYVMYGASGDGLTAENPAGSLATVVGTINENYGEGDNVTVYVMKAADEVDISAGVTNIHFVQLSGIANHAATITYQSYDSNNISTLTFLDTYEEMGHPGGHMYIKGPSVFDNIRILDNRTDSTWDILCCGYDVTITDNAKIVRPVKTDNVWGFQSWPGHFYAGVNRANSTFNGGGTINIPGGIAYDVSVSGYTDSNTAGLTYTNDQTVKLRQGTLNILYLDNVKNTVKTTYQKNVNILLDGTNVVKFTQTTTPVISGALQIIKSNGAAIETDTTSVSPAGGKYVLTVGEGGTLDVTSTAGTYVVNSEKIAVAQDANGKTFVAENSRLTVPAGEYTVNFFDSLEDSYIEVKYDGVADGKYIKGSKFVLKTPDDISAYYFAGWTNGENTYAAGETITLPSDVEEINYTSAWNLEEDTAVVYLDAENGSDSNSGDTAASAVASFAKAFEILNNASTSNKYILVVGSVAIDGTFASHSSMITIAGDGSGNSQLRIDKDSCTTNGPTKFENIDFAINVDSKFINTGDYEFIFGEGITVSTSRKVNMHAGTSNANGEKVVGTINSGEYGTIYVGASYNYDSTTHTTAGVDFVINGGTIANLAIGADGWLTTHVGCVFTEDVNITINGGTVTKVSSSRSPAFEKGLAFIFNNGTSCTIPDFGVQNTWIMKSADTTGNALKATATTGEFEVVGGKTAIASCESNPSYVSASGILAAITPGTYDITYTDTVYYTNDGTKITFYEDYTLDLGDVRYTKYDGKLFIGWADSEGNSVIGSDFKKGDELYAQYVDCDLAENGDFYIKGVQIRTSGTPGLRFVINKTDSITDALSASEYGAVVIPAEVVGAGELTIGGTYTFNSKQYDAQSVVGVNTFADYEDSIDYTLCIIGIEKEIYRRQYMVRGYIKYTDLQGNDKVLYTNYYSMNLYRVAKEALNDTDANYSEDVVTYLESIRDYVDETMKQEYLSQEKIDVIGTSADPNTWIYRLGENGVYVREVEIDSGKGGTPIEVVQISDTHYNYCNERDFEENNPAVMSTWENRTAFKYPYTQTALTKSIEYASYSDQIMLTGDAIDYLSWGCIELLYKYIWDPYPDTIISLGNHEPVRQMQGLVSDPSSLESRYQILKDNWKNDVYHTKKILSDENGIEKVMLVQLDNSQSKFWDNQVPLLEADIAEAREKQIPLLLFYHIPLATRNPEDAEMDALRRNDPYTANWYNASQYVGAVGRADTTASKEIYDLITMNPDVIKGLFCGHMHSDFYTEIISKNADGTDNPDVVIPQYVLTGAAYETGHALRITIK